MDIFEYTNYRQYLQSLVKNREAKGKTQVELANAMGCQAAYFSQVLKEKADLTEDHAIKLCVFLDFNGIKTEYFLVILRIARAGTSQLKSYLEKTREKLIADYQEVEGRISTSKRKGSSEDNVYYCSSWIPAVIHSGTSCEAYQTILELSKRFNIESSVVDYHLQSLEKYGLVEFKNGKWLFKGGSLHIPKNSALDQSFQISRRIHAMNSIAKRKTDDIHYSMVFSADITTVKKIRQSFIDTIEETHKISVASPSEDVYALCLDFFNA